MVAVVAKMTMLALVSAATAVLAVATESDIIASGGVTEQRIKNTNTTHATADFVNPKTSCTPTRLTIKSLHDKNHTETVGSFGVASEWAFNLKNVTLVPGATLVIKDGDNRRSLAAYVASENGRPCNVDFVIARDRLMLDYVPPADTCADPAKNPAMSGSLPSSSGATNASRLATVSGSRLQNTSTKAVKVFAEAATTTCKAVDVTKWTVTPNDRTLTCSETNVGEAPSANDEAKHGWFFNFTELSLPPRGQLLVKAIANVSDRTKQKLETAHNVTAEDPTTWVFTIPTPWYRIDKFQFIPCKSGDDNDMDPNTMTKVTHESSWKGEIVPIDSYCAKSPRPSICTSATTIKGNGIGSEGPTNDAPRGMQHAGAMAQAAALALVVAGVSLL